MHKITDLPFLLLLLLLVAATRQANVTAVSIIKTSICTTLLCLSAGVPVHEATTEFNHQPHQQQRRDHGQEHDDEDGYAPVQLLRRPQPARPFKRIHGAPLQQQQKQQHTDATSIATGFRRRRLTHSDWLAVEALKNEINWELDQIMRSLDRADRSNRVTRTLLASRQRDLTNLRVYLAHSWDSRWDCYVYPQYRQCLASFNVVQRRIDELQARLNAA